MYHGLLFLQKIDRSLSPKFQGDVFRSSKDEKEGFLYRLAGKQQKS